MAQQSSDEPTIIIRRGQVQHQTGLSKSGIYDKLDPKSPGFDPTFPKQVSIGARAVGWVEAEIEAWIHLRVIASRSIPKQRKRPKSRGTARRVDGESSGGGETLANAEEDARAVNCTARDPKTPDPD